jgi:DNA-binding transcriptional regulator LsrR (DeoR family)
VVPWDSYSRTKGLPGVKDSFEAAKQIDILVTSLGYTGDEHSLLKGFMGMASERGRAALDSAGWVGDVLWRPYSRSGPITADTGIRAVTLFELEDLVAMGHAPGKHVILLAGPCAGCNICKAPALRPLLCESRLRVANHVVLDIRTAEELLPGAETPSFRQPC